MKKLLLIPFLFTSCISLDFEPEIDCNIYNDYINALYDKKLEILFQSVEGKYEFKGEIKIIEKERWSKLMICE